jgi:serine/threonine protein kinase
MTIPQAGETLGGYTLEQVIGEGGYATVYKAYQVNLKRWVAMKVLYKHQDSGLERFQREAKAVASLRHRNILIIYEYGEQNGHPFLAMEYVEGGTLEDKLEKLNGQPLPWRQAVELTIPIADALGHAHQHGIIHRDVKPSNILMPQEDWPVLADFGLVKHSDEEVGLTQSGMFLGTPGYVAPEQARDSEVDYRADMYALGVILFELATGRLPFDNPNPQKILLAHVLEEPPHPRSLNPDIPVALEEIILKTLRKNPKERYADMAELIGVLKGLLETREFPVVEETEAAPASVVPEKPQSWFSRLLDMLLGRPKPVGKSAPSRTELQPQLEDEEDWDDDEDELFQTVRLSAGGASAQLVLGENVSLKLPHRPVLVIGRTFGDSTADIDLEPYEASKYGISRQHAKLTHEGGLWLLDDMNSLNGTFVNGRPVKHGNSVALKDGDKIRLSQMTLVFKQA